MTLRIASYNIRNGRAPDWRSLWWRRRPALAAFAIALLFVLSLRWVLVHERWIQPIFREEPGQRLRDTSSISKSFGQSFPVTKRRFEESS